jgi:thiamine biosynthesis lipoprotein
MNKDRSGHDPILRFSHQAMGTLFEIGFPDIGKKYARQISQAVFKEIDRLENLLSRFNPGSDIGQLNSLKPGQSCLIGIETMECLEKAFQIQNQTKGAFAVHYASLKTNQTLDYPLILSRSSQRYKAFLKRKWILPSDQGLQLDLGGMGKGFALDKAVDLLADWDIHHVLIHAGTSTALALGSPLGKKGWTLGVTSGWDCPSVPRKIVVTNRAVSGSGKQVKGEHILDPRTGLPATGHQAAWVSHPSATVADALSTAFVVMTTSEIKEFCSRHLQVWTAVVLSNGVCKTFNKNII